MKLTLPKANSCLHLKIHGWKTSRSFLGFGLFSGANLLLVSGMVTGTKNKPLEMFNGLEVDYFPFFEG